MEAFLVSQSQDIWDATQSTTFVVLLVTERTTPTIVARHEANAKAVNFLFSGLSPMDYERVSHLKTAREIWSLLSAHHEGTAMIKARLVQTYRHEYENFVQKLGESVDDLFGRFQSIINKLRVNSTHAKLPYTDQEQLAMLGDDELCLVSSRFQRAYDNRMRKKRGERPKCFECGEGKSYSCDSDKCHSGKPSFDKHRSSKHSFDKRPFGKKNFRKAFKSYQKDNWKWNKEFFAEIGFCSSGPSFFSSLLSSSDEEITYKKDKRNDQGGPAGLCFVSTKSKRKHKFKRSSVCSMVLEDKGNKDDDSDSSSDDEVTPEQAKILEMLEQNSQELKAQDKMLEKAAKKLQKLKAQLAEALEENERLRSVRPPTQ
ncbi:hypothetical protein U9M48_018992 [Paspalum notatum var. saurae]|uniref:Uncharacterized protein n=1 Tax=Paspalum notatum var. saurae TaxID=547442 RepID=A0AAQ3WQB4_PASNO